MLAPGPLIRAARAGGTGSTTGTGSGSDGSSGGESSGSGTSTGASSSSSDGSTTVVDGTEGPPSTTTSSSTAGDTSTSGSGTDGVTDTDVGFDGSACSGCYGRPYIAQDRVRVASITETDAWLAPLEVPSLGEADAAQRAALAEFWTSAALSEHSSVAGFHRFALDLLAHGAPPELVMRAQRAAIEELEHARACFGLASAYAGRPIGPGPMPLGTSAPIASTLAELAVWTVHEGCVGETVAAWLASEIHEHAKDPVVCEVMAKISREEAEHAELAWAVLRWAISAGGEVVRRAVADAFAAARVAPPKHGSAPCASHGLLPDALVEATVQAAFSQVVQPCGRALAAA